MRDIIVSEDTLVYDYKKGIVRLSDISSLYICDKYGRYGTIQVGDSEDRECSLEVSSGAQLGVESDLPIVASYSPRKWKLLHGDEWDRRNFFAEHYAYTEKDGASVIFSDEEDGEQLYSRLRRADRLIPFYGVGTKRYTFEEGEMLHLDPKRPVCFVQKMMPYNEKELEQHVNYWTSGGWFRTLTPVNDRYIERVLSSGVFFEGEKGYPDYKPVILLDEKSTLKCKTLTIEDGFGIDFGKLFIN